MLAWYPHRIRGSQQVTSFRLTRHGQGENVHENMRMEGAPRTGKKEVKMTSGFSSDAVAGMSPTRLGVAQDTHTHIYLYPQLWLFTSYKLSVLTPFME